MEIIEIFVSLSTIFITLIAVSVIVFNLCVFFAKRSNAPWYIKVIGIWVVLLIVCLAFIALNKFPNPSLVDATPYNLFD